MVKLNEGEARRVAAYLARVRTDDPKERIELAALVKRLTPR